MAYDAGTAFLQIVPSFRGFGAAVRREAQDAGRQAGRTFSEEFNRQVRAGTNGSVGPDRAGSARQGAASAGAFAEAFRRRLEAAQRSLGDVEVGVATSEAEQRIKELRARIGAELATLRDARIGVDIDEGAAFAKLAALQTELTALSSQDPDIRVRVDAGRAAAELTLLQTQIRTLDGQNPTITPVVNPAPAVAGIGLIGIAALSLLPVLIPIAAAASAALAGIATGAFVATAGIGVLVLGLTRVVQAVMAGGQADKAAQQNSASLAGQRLSAANAADQLRSAERALANTRATAARQERDAARAVRDALRAVTDARRAAADAAQRAADRVAEAEGQLRDAQERATDAQISLTRARRDAAAALQDLDSRVKNNALAQRDAALDLEAAEAQLAFVREFGAQATTRQVEQAQLAYDRAAQKVADLALEQDRLTAEQDAANKAGVEGSEQVTRAREDIEDANEAVADSEAELARARQEQVRAEEESARRIAAAIDSVTQARERAAEQQRQSAFALANAEQAVVSAQRGIEQASLSAATAGAAATNKFADAMAKLSPAGQAFVEFIRSRLLPGFSDLRAAAEESLLPGLQRGMEAAAPLFAPLERLVRATGDAFGALATSAGRALGGPFWTQFTDFLAQIIGPNTEIFGRILGGLARGFAGLFQAFEPISRAFGDSLADLAQRFADFGERAGAGKSEGFNSFLDYVREVGPKVVDFFRQFGRAVGNVIKALAPIGGAMMAGLTLLFRGIAAIPPAVIGALVAGFLAFAVALKVTAAATFIFGGALKALILGNPIGIIIASIAALAVGLVYAYKHSETFRNIVNTAFRAVRDVVVSVWQDYLRPALSAIAAFVTDKLIPAIKTFWQDYAVPAFKAIGDAATFLWHNVIQPAFRGIADAIDIAWTRVIKPIFNAYKAYLTDVLFPVIRFLWDNVIKPVFKGIGDTIDFAWNKVIKPILTALGDFIRDKVAPAFRTGVDAVAKAWDGLREAAKAPVKFVIQTVINDGIISGINTITGLFGIPKIPPIPLPKGFATGGIPAAGDLSVFPGYTPGRDTGLIAVGGGEAIMRPEWTRAVGPDYVHTMNALARRGGVSAVAKTLGIPGFKLGGIWDKVKGAASGLKDFSVGAIKALADPAGFVREQLSGKLGRLSELSNHPFMQMVKAVPAFLIDALVDSAKKVLGLGSGANPANAAALAAGSDFAARQSGKPYVFGATGPSGYDCSGFMGAIANVMTGSANPFARLFTTASFAGGRGAGGFKPGDRGGFVIGVVQGDPGHMAGTLAGRINVESRAGDGVVIGGNARGADHPLFTNRFHLAGYDSGGFLPPGVSVAVNATGRPEPVLTSAQWAAMSKLASGGDGAAMGRTGPLIGELHTTPNQSPYEIAAELAWAAKGYGL